MTFPMTNEYQVVSTYSHKDKETVASTITGIDKRVDAILLARQEKKLGFNVYVYEMNPVPILEEEGEETEPDIGTWLCPHGESLSDPDYEDIESSTDYCYRMGHDM